jgi:serine/threonine-protein kinase
MPPVPAHYGGFPAIEALDTGAQYRTFLSRHPATGEQALLSIFAAADDRARAAFLSSLLPLGILHPNILRILTFGENGTELYVATEKPTCTSLREQLASLNGRPMELCSAVALTCQLLEGVHALHERHIFHRNLKPANVWPDLDARTLKLGDFRIAVLLKSEDTTTHVAGTLPYMSPEVLEGTADRRADLYAVGVILFEMCTGQLPFWVPNQQQLVDHIINKEPGQPRDLNPAIPESLSEVIMRAIQKDPARRFQTALDFRTALVGENPPPDVPEYLMRTIHSHTGQRRHTGKQV